MTEQHGTRPPTSTVFIGNIPYDVTEQMLMDIFSEVGPIKSMRMVIDKESGKTKGYGFCEYFDKAIAIQAVQHLNKHEVSGRTLRVDYADEHSADNTDRRPPRKDGHGGGGGRGGREGGNFGPAPPPGTRPVGHHAAAVSSQQMSTMLGGLPTITYSQDRINSTIAGMTPMQLFEIMSQMRQLITQNQLAARNILVQNPQLTKALFQAQILLGMVKQPTIPAPAPPPVAAPLGPPAPPQLQSQPYPAAAPPQFAPPPSQPIYVTASVQQLPPPQQPLPQQPSPLTLVALPNGLLLDPNTGQHYNASGQPVAVQLQQPAQPVQVSQPQPLPVQIQLQQPMQQSLIQQQPVPQQPPMQQSLMQQQPMQQPPMQQQPTQQPLQQPMQQPVQQAPAASGMTPENQNALLQAVLTMSQEQIDALPPVQREQVLAVRQQISGMRTAA